MDYKKLSRVTDSKRRVSDAKSVDEILRGLGIITEDGSLDKNKLITVLQASGAIE